jgi:hypothetical protein
MSVLFERGSKQAANMWDDTEMIAAWNSQLRLLHRTEGLPAPAEGKPIEAIPKSFNLRGLEGPENAREEDKGGEGDSQSLSERGGSHSEESGPVAPYSMPNNGGKGATEANAGQMGRTGAVGSMMPPFPQTASEDLRALLTAWYHAGYSAGKFDARH